MNDVYRGFNGEFDLREDMDLEVAREFKKNCLDMDYKSRL